MRVCARAPVACPPLSVADRQKRPQRAGHPCASLVQASQNIILLLIIILLRTIITGNNIHTQLLIICENQMPHRLASDISMARIS